MQSIQFFLSAIVADRSIRILRKRNMDKFKIAWMARPLFIIASSCNLVVGCIWYVRVHCSNAECKADILPFPLPRNVNYANRSVWNIGLYTISQDRSVAYITSYKLPDVLGLAVGLPVA